MEKLPSKQRLNPWQLASHMVLWPLYPQYQCPHKRNQNHLLLIKILNILLDILEMDLNDSWLFPEKLLLVARSLNDHTLLLNIPNNIKLCCKWHWTYLLFCWILWIGTVWEDGEWIDPIGMSWWSSNNFRLWWKKWLCDQTLQKSKK